MQLQNRTFRIKQSIHGKKWIITPALFFSQQCTNSTSCKTNIAMARLTLSGTKSEPKILPSVPKMRFTYVLIQYTTTDLCVIMHDYAQHQRKKDSLGLGLNSLLPVSTKSQV